jgi:formamidopyrimidine-DNA glycosylase
MGTLITANPLARHPARAKAAPKMPELPEVETVRGGLAPVLEGHRLARVEARRPDLRFPLPPGFVQELTGARIERLERRAKYLLARLDREDTLVMHLGMSGRFEIAIPSTRTWSSRPTSGRRSPITTRAASAT